MRVLEGLEGAEGFKILIVFRLNFALICKSDS